MNSQTPTFLLAGLFFGLAWGVSRSQNGSGALYGLGDDPIAPPSDGDYDPRKAGRGAFLRTHLAKKFWGTTVLAAQASDSLSKLATRMRPISSEASNSALSLAREAHDLHMRSLALARKYNEPWVRLRIESGKWPGGK